MPEQVYDPNLDVWYSPGDSDDGSNSGNTTSNVNSLIDQANSSSESDRDSSWWNNFLNNSKYVWGKIKDFFTRNNVGFAEKTRQNVFESSLIPHIETTMHPKDSSLPISKPAHEQLIKEALSSDDDVSSDSGSDKEKNVFDDNYGKDVNQWLGLLEALINKQYEFNESNAIRAQQFEEQQAQKLRDWQEYMSSTSYQRAMNDLKAAGINPLLAFQTLSGASTPSGAMASGFNASGSLGNASSYYSSLISQLGQNKQAASSFLNLIVRLLGLVTML